MKLPFTFGIKLVFRLLLPGFFLTLGFLPVLQNIFDLACWPFKYEYVFPLSVIIMGWLAVLLDMPIYMLFEGRRYWPSYIRKKFISLEKRRLNKIQERTGPNFKKCHYDKYLEASVEIRKFPIDEDKKGEYDAFYPSRLGNLLASYEAYPKRIYGMDVVFYWYRIWLKLDKDLREDIDSRQAMADSAVYTSFALFTVALLCIVYAAISILGTMTIKYLPNAYFLAFLSFLSLIIGYLVYRLSIYSYTEIGEIFKSIFDIYEKEIDVSEHIECISELLNNYSLKTLKRKEKLAIVLDYLQYYRIECPECNKMFSPTELKEEGHDRSCGVKSRAVKHSESKRIT